MSFLGSLNCGDVLPFLFYSSYLWDSHVIFLLLIFFCEINFPEFLKEALIWFDWFSNLTELTLLSFPVATSWHTCLSSPQLLPEHPFSFLSVICVILNLGSTSRSYSLGALPWKLALAGQFQAFLECPHSFRLPYYKLLHLPTFGACPNSPPQCQFWLWLSCRAFPSHALSVAPLLASTSPPLAASSSIHKHTCACAFINGFLILCSSLFTLHSPCRRALVLEEASCCVIGFPIKRPIWQRRKESL